MPRQARRFRSASVFLMLVLLPGCRSPSTPAPRSSTRESAIAADPIVEGRAALLMMADRRLFEPFTVRRILVSEPTLRPELALTLGRIGHQRGQPVLENLLEDRSDVVRRNAAFALGLLGASETPTALLTAAGARDRRVGETAVGSLARLGRPLAEVQTSLGDLAPGERWARLLPHLFRFAPEATRSPADRALVEAPKELRPWAAYALARRPLRESAPRHRELLGSRDPWVRGWAARALGVVGDGGDVARLRSLLDDPAPGPIIQALRATRALVAAGRTAPPEDWLPRLIELMADERPGVRLTAIEAAAAWLKNEELAGELLLFARQGLRRERELALLALAAGGDPRAPELAAEAARAADPVLRARAAEAAALLGAVSLLEDLQNDGEPGVRLAVLAARLGGDEGVAGTDARAAEWARSALGDPDAALRAAGLEWLAGRPLLPYEELREAMVSPGSRFLVDVGLNGVEALVARAEVEALERGAIVELLEQIAQSWDYPVRKRAADGLGELGRQAPSLGEFETRRGLSIYRDLARRSDRPRIVDLVTRHGTVRLRIDCPTVPLSCINFLQLVGQGFYDGLEFHRVVPDFVVQTGDPRGDGWGGAGYTIRDENGPRSYGRGVVGMALSGPNTGGSQFFITLAPQPHLDGTYTVLGSVAAGDEVLDRIVQGDRLLRATEVVAAP